MSARDEFVACTREQIGTAYCTPPNLPREEAQKPDAKGLVVPGMPAGSPGMELPDGRSEPYTVELIGRDGSSTTFARH